MDHVLTAHVNWCTIVGMHWMFWKIMVPLKVVVDSGLPPLASGGGVRNVRRDYTPVSWDQYFTQRTIVTVANDVSLKSVFLHYFRICLKFLKCTVV